jgi:hypothetical protein
MSEVCELRAANGEPEVHCEGGACVFWRVVGHVGQGVGAGCAIQHYKLLGEEGVAAWLLSVKERLESVERSAMAEAG